jgi:hypothetical protein
MVQCKGDLLIALEFKYLSTLLLFCSLGLKIYPCLTWPNFHRKVSQPSSNEQHHPATDEAGNTYVLTDEVRHISPSLTRHGDHHNSATDEAGNIQSRPTRLDPFLFATDEVEHLLETLSWIPWSTRLDTSHRRLTRLWGILYGYYWCQIILGEYLCRLQEDDRLRSLIGGFPRFNTMDVINWRLHEAPGTKNLSINDRLFSQVC